MQFVNRNMVSKRISCGQSDRGKSLTKLQSVLLEAKRIRMLHNAGKITAEEAAERLGELHDAHRHKPSPKGKSLLSA